MKRNVILPVALAIALFAGSPVFAQFPGTPQPKHYPWSDVSLSPDQRADMVIKEMTLNEKISLLHGAGISFFSTGPTESNGGAGYTKSISRLGIPAIQMADSAYGVTQGAMRGRYSTALPNNLGAASSWDPEAAFAAGESKQVSVALSRDRLTVYDEASDSWKLVPGSYVIRAGGSSQDLPLQQEVSF